MINLIEHLWQFEVKGCKIVPTVVKVRKESAKAYFYSEKQGRVLRKKEYGVGGVVSALRVKEKPGMKYLSWKIEANRRVVPELLLENQVIEVIEEKDSSCAISNIEDCGLRKIIDCSLFFRGGQF